jgi:hypothetical protein
LLRKAVPEGPAKEVLRGTPLGHPLHPALVAVPIGAWASATLFDLLGDDAGARRLTAIGCLAAVPAALAGGTDWLSTDGAQRRVGLVHALPVIPVAKTPTGGLFDLAMYIPTGGVPVTGGTARSAGSTATPPLTTARTATPHNVQ